MLIRLYFELCEKSYITIGTSIRAWIMHWVTKCRPRDPSLILSNLGRDSVIKWNLHLLTYGKNYTLINIQIANLIVNNYQYQFICSHHAIEFIKLVILLSQRKKKRLQMHIESYDHFWFYKFQLIINSIYNGYLCLYNC